MKFTGLALPIVIFCLGTRVALAQDPTLECFRSDLGHTERVAACDAVLSREDLPQRTRALALLSRARAHSQNENRFLALNDFDSALAILPDEFTARLDRGQLLEDLNRHHDAETDYTIIIDQALRTEEVLLGNAYARRGALRLAAGETSAGIADLGQARRFDPRNPAPFKIRGAYFLENDNIEQAAAELEQATSLNAGDVDAQLMFGKTQLRLAQPDAAVRAFSSALIVEPNNVDALRGRATAYGQQQNYATAIADYTSALNIVADDWASLEGRGAALLRIGAFNAAIQDFDKVLGHAPQNENAVFFRANARFQNGNASGAVEDFSTILAKHPQNIDARVGRGIARQFDGDYDGAEEDFTVALDAVPDAAQSLANRGYVRVMKGDFAAAVDDFTAALSLPNAPVHLALWKYVAEARAGNPNPETLSFALRTLDDGQWPAPILNYFLGQATGNEVISAALLEPMTAAGSLCEAYFFLGQAALVLGDPEEAKRLFKGAVDTAAVRFTEYAGAKAELSQLDKVLE